MTFTSRRRRVRVPRGAREPHWVRVRVPRGVRVRVPQEVRVRVVREAKPVPEANLRVDLEANLRAVLGASLPADQGVSRPADLEVRDLVASEDRLADPEDRAVDLADLEDKDPVPGDPVVRLDQEVKEVSKIITTNCSDTRFEISILVFILTLE